jgi:hypothetical protein
VTRSPRSVSTRRGRWCGSIRLVRPTRRSISSRWRARATTWSCSLRRICGAGGGPAPAAGGRPVRDTGRCAGSTVDRRRRSGRRPDVGAEDLLAALGGRSSRNATGAYRDVARHAWAQTLLAAGAAGKRSQIGGLTSCLQVMERAAASSANLSRQNRYPRNTPRDTRVCTRACPRDTAHFRTRARRLSTVNLCSRSLGLDLDG